MKKTGIIGAGIAGLCTAYWLKKSGYDVTVLERQDHPGGAIRTIKESGYLIDLGPNSALETSEALKDLIRDLGLEDQKLYGSEKSNKRYILKNGRPVAIPMGITDFLKTTLWSWKARLRLLKEPFIRPSSDENISLADLVEYRLGREFLDYAINPFVAGVYAGDPRTLSAVAGFPKLYALEQKYGSFIKGAFLGARERKKRKEVSKDRARMFSFREGMQAFPDALAKSLGTDLKLNTEIIQITPEGQKYRVTFRDGSSTFHTEFDELVLCTPAYVMAGLISPWAPEMASLLGGVYYPPVTVVFMGFREEDVDHPLDGFGFLIPEVEKREILGSLWSSSIFPGRAPQGHVAFTTFVGGTRQPENALAGEEELKQMVYQELSEILGIRKAPVFTKVKTWKKAIPQYRIGYQEVQRGLDNLEAQLPGLYFAGNFRRGISVGDSVLSAYETFRKMSGQPEGK